MGSQDFFTHPPSKDESLQAPVTVNFLPRLIGFCMVSVVQVRVVAAQLLIMTGQIVSLGLC